MQKPESWAELSSTIDTILDTPPERRAALIEQLSAGDATKRADLERLLEECEQESTLLSRSAAKLFAGMFDDDVAEFPQSLRERYRMEKELGRGGMATVYLARDLKHGRDVAVKVVHPRLTSALGADRFLREIEIVAQLQHPHIVALYDSGEADGSLYYVMPFETGLSLRDKLAREGALAPEDVVSILHDVCDAVAHAHDSGVVHRDIKPDNVLMSGRHAMVADFGVAKAAKAAAAAADTTIPLGTPAYMAPEQIEGRANIDRRADVYAIGVLGYELLTGRPPFIGDTRREIISDHLEKEPTPISTLRPDVPQPLSDLVMRALEKDPADRWQSADEMVRALEEIAATGGRASIQRGSRWRWLRSPPLIAAALVVVLVGAFAWYRLGSARSSWQSRWNNARIEQLTDFPGSEVDAAISPNGQLVTFLADRDSVFDAFVMKIGSEQFTNLTRGRFPELFNEDVRNVGFSGDASHVWLRIAAIGAAPSVSMIPVAGGEAQPFLKGTVTAAWSPDRSRIAYHQSAGDPIYVADANGDNARRILVSSPAIHNHYPAWSPDGRFIYFSRGLPPDEMDIWRISSSGGTAERITEHNSRVAYPVLLDARTLLYTATADDGTGPWLYSMDLGDRVARRVNESVERYLSISASAEIPGAPRRLVATVSNPSVQLQSAAITNGIVDEKSANRIVVPTSRSAAPRFGRDGSLYYLASRGGADGVWRLSAGNAREWWKPTQGAVVGAPAVSPDGKTVCFPIRHLARSRLLCSAPDGTGARAIAESLDVRGAASWSPDGKWIAITARQGVETRVFKVPANGGSPVALVDSISSNPVWSPDGKFILYSGAPRARSVPLKAVTPEGKSFPLPPLVVDRVGDSYRFLPDGKALVLKQGGFRRQDFWLVDLSTGKRRQLTKLAPGESLQRFDVSPDGKQIVFERVKENSDIVLIELPNR
ncbi:MAG: protein kinase domain-containing protein [Gemmatimonadaceae bacterium]